MRNALLFTLLLFCGGCVSLIQTVGIKLIYHKADWPASLIHRDLAYLPDGATLTKHRLDLFVPEGKDFPTLVFVHGGGWNTGDKSLDIGGEDVYGNIGRFYAARGIAVAVINYRLLIEGETPSKRSLTLDDQIHDVAAATTWVYHNIKNYGGNAQRIYLSGHSAGAQLAALVALRPEILQALQVPSSAIKGVLVVSGAGLDLNDAQTDALTKDKTYYERRLADNKGKSDWRLRNSPITYLHKKAPPFLLLYAAGEYKAMQRQAHAFHDALSAKGIVTQLIEIPNENHERMVLVLSHPRKAAVPTILEFLKK